MAPGPGEEPREHTRGRGQVRDELVLACGGRGRSGRKEATLRFHYPSYLDGHSTEPSEFPSVIASLLGLYTVEM